MTSGHAATDETFERDLRAILEEMAPREVPEALRSRLVETATHPASRTRQDWLPRRIGLARVVAVLVVIVAVAAVVVATRPTTGPGGVTTPPHSSLISGWVEQRDGVYGYTMLRPANWMALGGDFPDGRQYLGPGPATDQEGIVIRAVNLGIPAAHPTGQGSSGLWPLFQQHPSLAGWTTAIEAMWASQPPTGFVVLRTLPAAKIYQVTYPGLGYVFLVAYAVDHGQPLVISLSASGTDADLGRLEAEGVVDDFATMVASATAIPADAQNVVPSLPSAPAGPSPAPNIPLSP